MSKEHDYKRQFNAVAARYNATFGLISRVYAQHIVEIITDITSESTIHDNAAGTGIVSSLILTRFHQTNRPQIQATDFSEEMILSLQDQISEQGLQDCLHAAVMDSQELGFEDEKFTHSIMNFAIFILNDPDMAAHEIWRTLKPGGTAVVTTWKENGFVDWIHRTQKSVRPDLPLFAVYDEEWQTAEKLQGTLERAGFDADKIRIEAIEDHSWPTNAVMKLMLSEFTSTAKKGWSDEDKDRWETAVRDCMTESEKATGTTKMVAWIALATK